MVTWAQITCGAHKMAEHMVIMVIEYLFLLRFPRTRFVLNAFYDYIDHYYFWLQLLTKLYILLTFKLVSFLLQKP